MLFHSPRGNCLLPPGGKNFIPRGNKLLLPLGLDFYHSGCLFTPRFLPRARARDKIYPSDEKVVKNIFFFHMPIQ